MYTFCWRHSLHARFDVCLAFAADVAFPCPTVSSVSLSLDGVRCRPAAEAFLFLDGDDENADDTVVWIDPVLANRIRGICGVMGAGELAGALVSGIVGAAVAVGVVTAGTAVDADGIGI